MVSTLKRCLLQLKSTVKRALFGPELPFGIFLNDSILEWELSNVSIQPHTLECVRLHFAWANDYLFHKVTFQPLFKVTFEILFAMMTSAHPSPWSLLYGCEKSVLTLTLCVWSACLCLCLWQQCVFVCMWACEWNPRPIKIPNVTMSPPSPPTVWGVNNDL